MYKMTAGIKPMREWEVVDALSEIQNWNEHLNIKNIIKLIGTETVDWYGLLIDGNELVAVAAIRKSGMGPVDGEVFLNQICARSGHGFGRVFIEGLFNHFNQHHQHGENSFGFTADPEAGPGLLKYYRKWFTEANGWDCWKTKMGWSHFQRQFDRSITVDQKPMYTSGSLKPMDPSWLFDPCDVVEPKRVEPPEGSVVYTSYFGAMRTFPATLEPIAICGGIPKWYTGKWMKKLAPSWSIWKEWHDSTDPNKNQCYVKRFIPEVLGKLDPNQTISEIFELAGPGKQPCLLCYEKPTDFCHRHLVADWLNSTGRVRVVEFDSHELPVSDTINAETSNPTTENR